MIVEVTSTESNHLIHRKQILTRLRLAKKRHGLLVNFELRVMRDGPVGVVNGLSE